jgi:hypothetical protein
MEYRNSCPDAIKERHLRFMPGMAVAGCLKLIFRVTHFGLIPGISLLVSFGARAQDNIEILYEYGESSGGD